MGELRTSLARNVALLALAALVGGCCRSTGKGSHADGGGPAPTSSVPRDATGLAVHVAGPRPPVRDVTLAAPPPPKDGVPVTARVMVSKVTPGDGLHVVLRFAPDPARGGTPPSWSLVGSRVVVTEASSGSTPRPAPRVFEVAAPSTGKATTVQLYGQFPQQLALDARGLSLASGVAHPWKVDAPFLARPGKATVRVEGALAGASGQLVFTTAELPIEVVEASTSIVPLADVTAEGARQVAAHGLGAPPVDRASIVDDVTDGRWVRFSLFDGGYHVSVVDALVSPAGRLVALQEFRHFTCVARGTPIATPRGDVPIEALHPGDVVWAWDETRGARVATSVLAVAPGARDGLVEIGRLRVTAEHPVLADGRWTPAGDVREGAVLVTLPTRGDVVAHPASVPGWAEVVDLSVGAPHTFFAGGVLVHNKAVAVEMAPGDPWRGIFLRTTDRR